ncbi:MAG: hypothetical protein ACPHL6_10000, partial [Rubripirellula sp.]
MTQNRIPLGQLVLFTLFSIYSLATERSFANDSWPEFRGDNGEGLALEDSLPEKFGESDHVTWKTELPGRG